jgi:hypothetical protein
MDVLNTPIGHKTGEAGLQVPFNLTADMVIVKFRNLSAIRDRIFYTDRISWFQGGELWVQQQKENGVSITMADLELLRSRARHSDVSPRAKGTKPQDIFLTFNGLQYIVPHTGLGIVGGVDLGKLGEQAPWIQVPEGAYDLYVGNYQRLHSRNDKERSDELARVRERRRDIILRGKNDKNEFAFVEASYEIMTPQAVAIDQDRVYSGDLVEV